MSTPHPCDVRGCDSPAAVVFDAAQVTGVAVEYAVCPFHNTALQEGETFDVSEDMNEMLMGADAPLDVINSLINTNVAGSTVTLILGRDGVEQKRVTFRMSATEAQELATDIKDWG